MPFGFDCFRKLRSLLGRKMVPRYFVDIPVTEKEFSMFLAFTDVEASFCLSCLLNRHHSFSFCRYPSSVAVDASSSRTHLKVLPRSCSRGVAFHLKCRLRQLHLSKVARMDLPRRNATLAGLGTFSRGSAVDSRSVKASRVCLGGSAISFRSRTLRSLDAIFMSVPSMLSLLFLSFCSIVSLIS